MQLVQLVKLQQRCQLQVSKSYIKVFVSANGFLGSTKPLTITIKTELILVPYNQSCVFCQTTTPLPSIISPGKKVLKDCCQGPTIDFQINANLVSHKH